MNHYPKSIKYEKIHMKSLKNPVNTSAAGLTKQKNPHIIIHIYEKNHDGDSILTLKAAASRGWCKPGASRSRRTSLPSCALNV